MWLLVVVLILLLCAVIAWGIARQHLSGPELPPLPAPAAHTFAAEPDSASAQAVQAAVRRLRAATAAVPLRQRLAATRAAWEALFADQQYDATFTPLAAGTIRGEWVLTPGGNPARRTLYLHGGAYAVGSAHSHRPLTAAFARLTGGAVLALDYRLMPEHRRLACLEDACAAYPWMLANGPQGAAPASAAFVAGDSAGGNLTLALIAWARDQRLRAPDAAVALSPQTDSTMEARSWKANRATDPMLGPSYGPLLKLPRTLLLFGTWLQMRANPSDPRVSPLFGDLAGLPPTLLQASSAEMLRDDSLEYAARARAAGSPVTLQIWPGMVHVWQLFNPELPEANAALAAIGAFLAEVEAQRCSSSALGSSASRQPAPV